ncbi:MAG: ROK family protein [Planctomycetaceae bacterium]|nr:ROK family protein [Planctomycetaceae bacterium]
MPLYGVIEAGGTKFVCAVASGPDAIENQVSIPTTTPQETLNTVINYFAEYLAPSRRKLDAIGIACFGPVDLDEKSAHYGYITMTPKPGWVNTEIAGFFGRAFGVPVGFDTDVNAAALGEYNWGAGIGLDSLIYLTVGTGIGGGAIVNGKPLHGLMHPEMGHILVRQDKNDALEGFCPYHQNCLEGLASGKAVDLRWGKHASELPDDHPAWQLEADYLAQGLVNYILTLSPKRIILGGGLMQKKVLYPLIRDKVLQYLNGYLAVPSLTAQIDRYIVPPGLGTRSGICGAIALAIQAKNNGE